MRWVLAEENGLEAATAAAKGGDMYSCSKYSRNGGEE